MKNKIDNFLILFLKETGLIKPLTKIVEYINNKLNKICL